MSPARLALIEECRRRRIGWMREAREYAEAGVRPVLCVDWARAWNRKLVLAKRTARVPA